MDETDNDPLASLFSEPDFFQSELQTRVQQLEAENQQLRAEIERLRSHTTVVNVDTTAVAAALQPWVDQAPEFLKDVRSEFEKLEPTLKQVRSHLHWLECAKRKKQAANARRGPRGESFKNDVRQSRLDKFYSK